MGSETPGRATSGRTTRLSRVDRLRSTREFQDVSRRGKRVSSQSFVVLVALRADAVEARTPGVARIGLTVSRRVGGAVVRNRVKRRLREWFRRSATRSAGAFDWVVIARPSAATLTGEPLRAELDALCGRAVAGAGA